MHPLINRIAAVLALVTASVASAGDLAPASELPAGDRYEVTNRFFVSRVIPESADTVTEVEMRARVNVRAIEISGAGTKFRFRVESLAINYAQVTSNAYNALRFDSEAEDPAFNASSTSLYELIDEPIEFDIEADRRADSLLAALRNSFANDTAGNLFRMFLSERVLSQSMLWIVNLPEAGHEASIGDVFTGWMGGRLVGEAMVHFAPEFTYTSREGDVANLSISGSGTVEDARQVDARLDGEPRFVPVTISVDGQGAWNVADHLMDSLHLEADAFLEPDEIDPLGRRIERRKMQIEITVERIKQPG
jgi:hypothetical protein